MTEIQSFLREIPLFQEFSAESLGRMVDHARERVFEPDEDIISYGRPGEVLGVILEGEAEVISGDEETAGQVLATFGPKSFFGEMSLIDGQPRSAKLRRGKESSSSLGERTRERRHVWWEKLVFWSWCPAHPVWARTPFLTV